MYEVNGIYYAGNPEGEIRIKAAKVLMGGMMLITFTSGERRLFDPYAVKGEAFLPLQDEKILRDFEIFHGIITWKNGEIDIAPEAVYEMSVHYDVAV